jgi:hypothetical protein
MTDTNKLKTEQIRVLLSLNREDAMRAEHYSQGLKCPTLAQLRVEREQLEHQLLILTGFQEAEAAKLASDLPVTASKRKDDDDGRELVHA